VKEKKVHLIDVAMYALGGTSLLFTIDGKLKKELKYNNKLLTETIGTNSILTMKEKVSEGIFTTITKETEELYDTTLDDKIIKMITHEYAYKVDDVNQLTGTYINASSFGTFLCNIVRNCIPYGGYTKSAKDNSKYYSYSDIKEFNNN
jgi:hypothetical protein